MPTYTKQWWKNVQNFNAQLIEYVDYLALLDKCKDVEEKVYLTLLYYTGARPAELLELKRENFKREDIYIKISIPTKKRGIGRTLFFEWEENPELKIVFNHAMNCEPRRPIFTKFKNIWQTRDFIYKISDYELTQYFFRHNRFTKLAIKGVMPNILKYFKGSKKVDSIEPYIHIGGRETQKITKLID